MFDIGWNELLLIAVVAIVVIGPKDLPRAMRYVGQWSGRMKRMAREFQGQFNEALREAELDDVKKSAEDIGQRNHQGGRRQQGADEGGHRHQGGGGEARRRPRQGDGARAGRR